MWTSIAQKHFSAVRVRLTAARADLLRPCAASSAGAFYVRVRLCVATVQVSVARDKVFYFKV